MARENHKLNELDYELNDQMNRKMGCTEEYTKVNEFVRGIARERQTE